MEGLIPYIYRAVAGHRNHQIRHSSSRRNLLLSSAESSSSGRSFGRDHVRHYDRQPKGDISGSFDNIAPQNIQLKQTDCYPSSQPVLHRRSISCCMFFSRDEASLGKRAIGNDHPAQFRHANSFHYRP
jgi:hypothetical protein